MSNDLGSMLQRAGLVNTSEVALARDAVASLNGTIPEQLVRLGAIEDETLTAFYRTTLLVPRVSPSDLARLHEGVLQRVPEDMARELLVIPVAADAEGNLTLAMSDPTDTKAMEEVGFFTGSYIIRAVATQAQIAWCLAHYYGQETSLYKALVAEGKWPALPNNRKQGANNTSDIEGDTGPMATAVVEMDAELPRASEEETGPMQTPSISRPKGQHPSPPELFDRAGEISADTQPLAMRLVDTGRHVVVDLSDGIISKEQKGTDTSPIVLDRKTDTDMKAQAIDGVLLVDESGPIILDKARRPRRRTKNTQVGMGVSESAPPVAGGLKSGLEGSPLVEGSPPPEDLDRAKSIDMVGDPKWGPPGSTIPPSFLGANPDALSETADGVPVAIEDRKTTEFSTEHLFATDNSVPLQDSLALQESQAAVQSPAKKTPAVNTPPPSKAKAPPTELVATTARLVRVLREVDRAQTRKGILTPLLYFLDAAFERTGFLALRSESLETWLIHGASFGARAKLDLARESAFRDVVTMQLPYVGTLQGDQEAKFLARSLDIPDALDLLALPVVVRERVVGVLFGLGSHNQVHEEHLLALVQAASDALERLLVQKTR